MKTLVKHTESSFGMSSVRGKYITVEKNLPFSFYYSPRNEQTGPRVKVRFNPNRFNLDNVGTLKLYDDWEFVPNREDKHVSTSMVNKMKQFFRDYLILFLLVWDKHVDDPELEDYFRGDINLSEFISQLDFYDQYSRELTQITTVQELEDFCRFHNFVNMYGN